MLCFAIIRAFFKIPPPPPSFFSDDHNWLCAQTSSNTSLHSASAPGITALDIHPADNNIVSTGGVDKKALVYNIAQDSIVATYAGHTKKVTGVALHPTRDAVLSSSLDSTVAVWDSKSGQGLATINVGEKERWMDR